MKKNLTAFLSAALMVSLLTACESKIEKAERLARENPTAVATESCMQISGSSVYGCNCFANKLAEDPALLQTFAMAAASTVDKSPQESQAILQRTLGDTGKLGVQVALKACGIKTF